MANQEIRANHLVGGTMTYSCLGDNNYSITLTIYRDCSSGTQFDNLAPVGIFNSAGNLLSTELVAFPGADTVPILLNNPCLVNPNVCVEKSEYQFTINLPPLPGGYDIVYQRCCRNLSAINIVNPSSTGSTYKVHIPDVSIVTCNSTPLFNNPPPTAMCVGYEFNYDLSATDVDGDSLYYSFGDAYSGGTPGQPAPNPPAAPPYNNIIWNPGYSVNYQIDAMPQFTIDSITGYLSGTPTAIGYYTFSINIKEYRNGVYVSEIYRDFLLTVAPCQSNTVANFNAQTNFCTGTTANFTNTSLNTTFSHWDFGDLTTNADTSLIQNPSYTYADTGIYTIRLIANAGFVCADTISHQFQIMPLIQTPSFIMSPSQCLLNNSFSFNAIGSNHPNDTLTWNFDGITNPFSVLGNSAQISYPSAGIFPVELTIQNFGCTKYYFDTARVFPDLDPNFSILEDTACQPFTLTFNDSSYAWTPISYFWNFGDGNTSSTTSPTNIYLNPGLFDVTLIVSTDSGCIDTKILHYEDLITVHPKPESRFRLYPKETYFQNHVITAKDISDVFYQEFNFGDGNIFTDRDVEYSYQDTGHYLFSQLVITEFGCKDTSDQTIWIKPDFFFFAPNTFTPNGDGLNDIFFPKIAGIIEYELQLFNRWGELFFSSKSLDYGWDGTHDNKPSPIDTYSWRAEVKTVDGHIHRRIGHVNLVR